MCGLPPHSFRLSAVSAPPSVPSKMSTKPISCRRQQQQKSQRQSKQAKKSGSCLSQNSERKKRRNGGNGLSPPTRLRTVVQKEELSLPNEAILSAHKQTDTTTNNTRKFSLPPRERLSACLSAILFFISAYKGSSSTFSKAAETRHKADKKANKSAKGGGGGGEDRIWD